MLVALCVLASGPAPAQERSRPFAKVEGWRVSANVAKDGRFAGCMAGTGSIDGTAFVIGFNGRWWLGLVNPAWDRLGSRKVPVRVEVDGKPVHQGQALQDGRIVIMTFGEGRESIAAFMLGQQITVTTAMGRNSYSLAGSFKATSALIDCVKARGAGAMAQAEGPGARRGGATVATRAQTLEMATAYLGKLGTEFSILEPKANILKNFPVNWTFPDGGFGGMVIYFSPKLDGAKVFDEFVADNARFCKGASTLQRAEPARGGAKADIVRYAAVGTCQEGENALATEFIVIAGPDTVVAILNAGRLGDAGAVKRREDGRKWSL